MSMEESWKVKKFKVLIDKLKSNPDAIVHTEASIMSRDVLELIELSKTTSKSEAIQFAIKFTVDALKANKLKNLRYAKKEAHEASDDLLDT